MSKIQFSHALFEQIGGASWVSRPGYFSEEVQPSLQADQLSENAQHEALNEVLAVEVFVPETSHEAHIPSDQSMHVENDAQQADRLDETVPLKPSSDIENAVVLIGAGLDTIWQNEDNQAWQLWQNIMKAFKWDESQVIFFDTELLVTEDMVFSTMEEVIDLGVEWVLTMDDEHDISEQLAEGVQVVSVPEFESMLSDPYSKQSFYQSVITLDMMSS